MEFRKKIRYPIYTITLIMSLYGCFVIFNSLATIPQRQEQHGFELSNQLAIAGQDRLLKRNNSSIETVGTQLFNQSDVSTLAVLGKNFHAIIDFGPSRIDFNQITSELNPKHNSVITQKDDLIFVHPIVAASLDTDDPVLIGWAMVALQKSHFQLSELKKIIDIPNIFILLFTLILLFSIIKNYLRKSQEITRLRDENLVLHQQHSELKQENKNKSSFVANMSHEIRTSLNNIINFSELLNKQAANNNQQHYLSTIQSAANDLLCLVNGVLDFSKIEANKMELYEVPTHFRDCIQEIIDIYTIAAGKKCLHLISKIDPRIPKIINCDPIRIKQIFSNLLTNAIKFTEIGSVKLSIECISNDENSITLACKVTDTGIGITKEQQKHLFHAFQQCDKTTSQQYGGTGLGLVICQRLIHQMQGSISIESNADQGCEFNFTLRLQKTADKTGVKLLQASDKTELEILIVEDDLEQISLIKHLFHSLPVKLTAVFNIEQLHDVLAIKNYDLALIDLHIPNENIEAIISQLDACESRPYLVAMSAEEHPKNLGILHQLGIDRFMSKPLRSPTVTRLLNHLHPQIELYKATEADSEQKQSTQLTQQFIADLCQRKLMLIQLYESNQYAQLAEEIHRSHGACCYAELPQLKEILEQLEKALEFNADSQVDYYFRRLIQSIEPLET